MGDLNRPVVCVSGSRQIRSYSIVAERIKRGLLQFDCFPAIVIEGGQRSYKDGQIVGGVDYFARLWAQENDIPCDTIDAKWSDYGLQAGPIRNREMAQKADYLIAIPYETGKGTHDMIRAMHEAGKGEHVYVEETRLVALGL